jgi:hypothetical protein
VLKVGALLLLLYGCAPGTDQSIAERSGQDTAPADVVAVPDTSPVALIRIAEFGSVSSGVDVGFGNILMVRATQDGSILTMEDAEGIRVVSPSGELLRIIGRRGQGPEELRITSREFVINGDTVLVPQPQAKSISQFTIDGKFIGTLPLVMPVTTVPLGWAMQNNGRVRMLFRSFSALFDLDGLISYDLASGAVDTLEVMGRDKDEMTRAALTAMLRPMPVWAAMTNGAVITGNSHRNELKVYGADGRVQTTLTLPFVLRDITPAEKLAIVQVEQARQIEAVGRVVGTPGIADHWPIIARLLPGADDTFWLGLFPARPDGAPVREFGALDYSKVPATEWEIRDLSGALKRRVIVPKGVVLQQIAGDRVYATGEGQQGEHIAILFSVPH